MTVDEIIKGLVVFLVVLVVAVVVLARSCWAEGDVYGDDGDRMPGWFVAITGIGTFALFAFMMWTYSEKKNIEMMGNDLTDSVVIIAPNNKSAVDFAFKNAEKVIILEDK